MIGINVKLSRTTREKRPIRNLQDSMDKTGIFESTTDFYTSREWALPSNSSDFRLIYHKLLGLEAKSDQECFRLRFMYLYIADMADQFQQHRIQPDHLKALAGIVTSELEEQINVLKKIKDWLYVGRRLQALADHFGTGILLEMSTCIKQRQ